MQPKPKKSLGQNFLVDKNIQEKIIQACNLRKSDSVLEIGPGRGEITEYLICRVKKVIAIEIDKELCGILGQRFQNAKNFELLHQDILKTDLSGYKNLKVIANIPYYISTPIISRLIDYKGSIKAIYLSVQKELAQRLIACCGSKVYGAYSCFVQFYTQPKILFTIKNSSFWPQPKVDSCFVELRILPKPRYKVKNEELLFKVIRLGFNQRRKLLKNSLAKIASQEKLLGCFKKLALPQNSRAEDLPLADFAKLADCLSTEFLKG